MADSEQGLIGRIVPARTLPAPVTVSPELRQSIAMLAQAPPLGPEMTPRSVEAWRAFIASADEQARAMDPFLKATFPHERQVREIAGVTVRDIIPATFDATKAGVLLHFHGGGYTMHGGEASVSEAILAAHYSRRRAISVDYRMPPDHPYPAAIDDADAVWSALIQERAPNSIGVIGTSAGGGLSLALGLRLKMSGRALPGAFAVGTPWADLTGASDSYRTNEGVDGIFTTYDGVPAGMAALYAGGTPLTDPLISPVFGDFAGFAPTILTTGTRDILLSDTVRIHRKLRAAGVESQLEVHEAMSHAEYIYAFTSPESATAFNDIAAFFDRHLQA